MVIILIVIACMRRMVFWGESLPTILRLITLLRDKQSDKQGGVDKPLFWLFFNQFFPLISSLYASYWQRKGKLVILYHDCLSSNISCFWGVYARLARKEQFRGLEFQPKMMTRGSLKNQEHHQGELWRTHGRSLKAEGTHGQTHDCVPNRACSSWCTVAHASWHCHAPSRFLRF